MEDTIMGEAFGAPVNDGMIEAVLRNDSPSPPPASSLQLPTVVPEIQFDEDESQHMTTETQDTSVSTPLSPERKIIKDEVKIEIDPPRPYASMRSGLVYDARMRFHAELRPRPDDVHPEDPRRIWEIFQELQNAGLIVNDTLYEQPEDSKENHDKLLRISFQPATAAQIALIHEVKHYEWVAQLKNKTEEELTSLAFLGDYDSVYFHKLTFYCAVLSCGGAIEACRAVVQGRVKNSIAVIRPPGHHAEPDGPAGFCFFNNVCVAARVCQRDFPALCRKVLILDWDVHHGNGVQRAFENDPNVLYISLHVHKNGDFYPRTQYGSHDKVGIGAGVGKNVNIPWPCHGMRDGDYLYAFQQLVMPISQEFDPDLVIISAGFDAAEGDLLGGCHVSPACYGHMTKMLSSLANGRVAVCLEGGYNLRSIAKSALAVTKVLMGEPPERIIDSTPTKPGIETVDLVKRVHSRYWDCLYPKDSYLERIGIGGERLHDVLRENQKHQYWDKYGMAGLHIHRDKVSKSFDSQVLATPNFDEPKPLLIIFHDPPEVEGSPDPVTGRLAPHNIIVTDVVKTYIDWAVKNGFGVIDVNIPEHITEEVDMQGYVAAPDTEESRTQLTRELATYLWENYIEPGDNTHLFFMGVGAAYSTIVWLLGNDERCQNSTTQVISFVGLNSLVGIQRPADDYIAAWFYDTSRIFVAHNHFYWAPERGKKIRKKYGDLEQSPHNDLPSMMTHHRAEVIELLLSETAEWREQQQGVQKNQDLAMGDIAGDGRGTILSSPRPGTGMSGSGGGMNGSSPRMPSGLKSPVKFPPRGLFGVTSPERGVGGVRDATGSPF